MMEGDGAEGNLVDGGSKISAGGGDANGVAVTCEPGKTMAVIDATSIPVMERKVTFPPPCSWYQPHVAAARDDMWGYIAMAALVVARPVGSCQWPDFQLLETSTSRFTSISFCQSSWDKLLIQDSPLVSGCSAGYVRIWNLKTNGVVQFHDAHKIAGLPQGFSLVVQWSPRSSNLIYAGDSNGSVSIWDLAKSNARVLTLGKVSISCMAVSPFEDDIIAIGSKAGNVMIVNTLGLGKIIAKMRHDEEVYSVAWKPEGIWGALNANLSNSNFQEPFLISSVSTLKPSTIRVWDRQGKDIAILRPVEKEEKKMSKNFLPALWACDSFGGASDGEMRLQLVTCGRQGEIISWTESSTVADEIHGLHSNYTIFGVIQCGDVLWSLSYEPVIVGWNLKQNHVEAVIPSFRGICSLQASPLDYTRVALGGMDNAIRIIGMDSGYPEIAPAKVPTVTAKLKGKVTAIAWHPVRENRLGFGTDEGVLGIYDWKVDNKFAMVFDKRVNGTIYTLDWGPSVYLKVYKSASGDIRHADKKPAADSTETSKVVPEEEKSEKLFLYACGGQAVHMISPKKFSCPLLSVSHIISKSNLTEDAQKKKNRISDVCTDIKWSPDYSYLAVGYNDGRIELYSAPHLKIRCWIKCHGRGIQFMGWRTTDFNQLTKSDSYWFASASNDGTARLFNLGSLFTSEFKENPESEVHQVISSVSTLNGHGGLRVLSLAWSRHNPDLIVTVSYDRTAVVWNATTGERIARYTGHQHRLVGCMFHPSDPFKVITTSDELMTDFSVHVWDYRCHPYIDDVKRAAKECASRIERSDPIKIKSERLDKSLDDAVEEPLADDRKPDKVVHVATKKPAKEEKYLPKKKPRPKSLLPLSANALINMKLDLEDELRYLVDKTPMPPLLANGCSTKETVAEKEDVGADSASVISAESEGEIFVNDPAFHLGVLGTSEECVKMVQLEKENHIRHKRWDFAMFLSNVLTTGSHENVQDMVKLAIKNRSVDETLLLIAQKHSTVLYGEAVQAYIQQLIHAEEYYKAAHYYILLDKLDDAIELLISKKFYREAVAISKCTVLPELQKTDVFDKWIDKAIDEGNLELACKICCAVGKYDQALSTIGMRNNPYAWKTGLYLSMKINDLTKAESFGLKYLEDAIVKNNYDECFQIIQEFNILKWLLPIIFVHQVLLDTANSFEQKGVYNERIAKIESKILENWATNNILEDKTFYLTKIKSLLLLAIPQNIAEAQILISKNMALMLLENETDMKAFKESSIQLADQWIKNKNAPLATTITDILSKLGP